MKISMFKITFVQSPKPRAPDVNDLLQHFGHSLGLFNIRDKDKSCYRIFVELLKSAKLRRPMSSDEIAYRLNLSRGTVIHHIHKLMETGIVVTHMNKYMLRVDNLKAIVNKIKQDFDEACEDLYDVASHIDDSLGL